jgi:hypothetical protein
MTASPALSHSLPGADAKALDAPQLLSHAAPFLSAHFGNDICKARPHRWSMVLTRAMNRAAYLRNRLLTLTQGVPMQVCGILRFNLSLPTRVSRTFAYSLHPLPKKGPASAWALLVLAGLVLAPAGVRQSICRHRQGAWRQRKYLSRRCHAVRHGSVEP